MTKYNIEHRIRTLAYNYVGASGGKPSFEIDDISFAQWNFTYTKGCTEDAWIASAEIESNSRIDAIKLFDQKLSKIISRLSLAGQAFISYRTEPFVISRSDMNFVLIHYVQEDKPVGLMFMEEGKEALELLIGSNISDEFFLLWNDAVNTTGYTAKILLMASAIEALIKRENETKDYSLRIEILGGDLKNKLYSQPDGLRHRLSHGEYLLAPIDEKTNYVIEIHRAVISYFNRIILKKNLLSEKIVDPQRNFINNLSVGNFFIKSLKSDSKLDIRSLIEAYQQAKADGNGLKLNDYGYDYVCDKNDTDIF